MTDFKNLVLIDQEAGVAEVTLNRPQAMNALNSALRARIGEVFDQLAQDQTIEVAILAGAGRAFCAGLDLKELGGEVQEAHPNANAHMLRALANFPHPIIGAINGFAVTGGFEIEGKASRAHGISADAVRSRRAAIQARARAQD